LNDFSRIYKYLIEKKFPILNFGGNLDSKAGSLSQYIWMKEYLNLTTYWEQDRKIYYMKDGTVGGWY
jgi:hypothetical protein